MLQDLGPGIKVGDNKETLDIEYANMDFAEVTMNERRKVT